MKAIFILEGKLNENDQHQLSELVDHLAKDWGLSSYLDDVLEDDVCEHNNTITSECSDCNEQELSDACYNANCDGDECVHNGDYTDTSVDDDNPTNLKGAILEHILPEIRNLIIDYNIGDRIYELVGQWSKSDFDMLGKYDFEVEIKDRIFKLLSVKSIMKEN